MKELRYLMCMVRPRGLRNAAHLEKESSVIEAQGREPVLGPLCAEPSSGTQVSGVGTPGTRECEPVRTRRSLRLDGPHELRLGIGSDPPIWGQPAEDADESLDVLITAVVAVPLGSKPVSEIHQLPLRAGTTNKFRCVAEQVQGHGGLPEEWGTPSYT
jgi:hypothetical protein